jgi:uncharacterized membrane protein HdeD (DUF308 family)
MVAAVLQEDVLDKLPMRWWAIMLRGWLGILLGIVAFFMPVSTLLALVYLFGAYAFFDGVFNLVAAWRQTTGQKPSWALLLSGIAGIGAAVISFVWPGITALALVYVVSAWALLTGGFRVCHRFRHSNDCSELAFTHTSIARSLTNRSGGGVRSALLLRTSQWKLGPHSA